MPTEIERLGRAMDDMGGRLRGVVVSVVGEASQIGNSASDFSAMSEELAASSGEISTAMVKIAASAEQQVSGMEKADALLVSLREIAEANAQASARVAELGDRIQELAARHRVGRGRGRPVPARRPRGRAARRPSRCRSWPACRSRSRRSSI